jgi:DNA-binding CsgD family transcriptional regulator
MLYGRRAERARIATLLTGARQGRSGVLVVRGPAGVGKRALLREAAEQANDFQLLHGAGVESEVELPFAALHQLLRPVLDRLDRLPAPQASALRGAFGLVDSQPNRFLIELGVLGLLAEVAQERPLLCQVADAQWLDRASADALAFVARRLKAEPVVLLLAAGDDSRRQFHAPGLPELRLGGLDREAAGHLLEAQVGKLAAPVRDRLIEETEGNPLALEELPSRLTGGQLSGREPLPARLPLSTQLERAFLERVLALPAATQMLLLVAAAEDAGELATMLAAGVVLAVAPEALEPAERAGLVQVAGQRLRFRHSLVRSAIYQGATFTARQTAHQALITVLQGEPNADRRAWHLAAATLGPDEGVAMALEGSAERARRRGGPTAAAAALERAAAFTPRTGPRIRRLVSAADYLWEAGYGERAQALLDLVEPQAADPTVRGAIAHVRGAIELACGTPGSACTLLVDGARLLLESQPKRATEMLVLATWAALAANQPHRILDEIRPAMLRLPGHDDTRVKRVTDGLIASGLGDVPPAAASPDVPREEATTWPHPAFTWMWPMLVVAEPAGDDVTADHRYARAVAARRAAGTVSTLTLALANLALAEAGMGRWPDAINTASEGRRLASETGQHAIEGYFLALLAAVAGKQGRAEDCRRLADEALTIAAARRLAGVAAFASWTLATLDLTEGRPSAALDRLLALSSPQHPTAHTLVALLATGTLVEAAARAGALAGTEPLVARFERWAARDQRAWTRMVAHRCRALLSQGQDAERHFQAALATHGIRELPLELARTELLYGEWLRRTRRRADARPHLRAALEMLQRLGATPWAERARDELRASGETARKRDPSTREQLTPQELQIAHLAGQGLSNQQIAARLFLSPHTVGYHLHNIYAKIGITSRTELHQLDPDNGDRR